MVDGPAGAFYNVSPNGWITSQLFIDWFKRVFLPCIQKIPGPHLLLLDGHSSHMSLELIQLARDNFFLDLITL